jgi:hypothetical protein
VFIDHERTVMLQLEGHGGPQKRRRTAGKVIAALGSGNLGVAGEAGHSAENMEAHLAAGGSAEILDSGAAGPG